MLKSNSEATIVATLMIGAVCCWPSLLFAQPIGPFPLTPDGKDKNSGALLLRIDVGGSRCVNASDDQVWLSMRKIVTTKKKTLFYKDHAIGVLVNTQISGDTGGSGSKVTYPTMREVAVEDYDKGEGISIPMEFPILRGFRLKREKEAYSGIEWDYSILRRKKESGWSHALGALIEVMKKLPLPSSPFVDGFQYFTDYANSAISKAVEGKDPKDILKESAISIEFSPNGECTAGFFAKTGIIAVVKDANPAGAGMVDIDRVSDYCFRAMLSPAFGLQFADKQNNKCGPFRLIRNDHILFQLHAVGSGRRATPLAASSAPSYSLTKEVLMSSIKEAGISDRLDVAHRALVALEQPATTTSVPFGRTQQFEDGSVRWVLTPQDAMAADVAESLRRCKILGVPVEGCFQ